MYGIPEMRGHEVSCHVWNLGCRKIWDQTIVGPWKTWRSFGLRLSNSERWVMWSAFSFWKITLRRVEYWLEPGESGAGEGSLRLFQRGEPTMLGKGGDHGHGQQWAHSGSPWSGWAPLISFSVLSWGPHRENTPLWGQNTLFKPRHCSSLALCPCGSYLISWCLGFLKCKIGIIIVYTP